MWSLRVVKTPSTFEACESVSTVDPVPMTDICVVRREDGKCVQAWDDVTGNELDMELTVKARKEEMDQFRKHGV